MKCFETSGSSINSIAACPHQVFDRSRPPGISDARKALNHRQACCVRWHGGFRVVGEGGFLSRASNSGIEREVGKVECFVHTVPSKSYLSPQYRSGHAHCQVLTMTTTTQREGFQIQTCRSPVGERECQKPRWCISDFLFNRDCIAP